jgi:hypothetical protein
MQGMYFTYIHFTKKNYGEAPCFGIFEKLTTLGVQQVKKLLKLHNFFKVVKKKYKLYKIDYNQYTTFSFDKMIITKLFDERNNECHSKKGQPSP